MCVDFQDGRTALSNAVTLVEIMELLISYGAAVDATDKVFSA